MMKMIEAVIFDIDGVVVDSDRLQSDAQKQTALVMAEELGIELDEKEIDWDGLVGPGRTIIAKNFLAPKLHKLFVKITANE